jgi:hypothetical protein
MLPDFLAAYAPPKETPILKKWSYSSWSLFKDVPYLLYAQEVLKIRREGGTAAARGHEIHQHIEDYVNGTRDDCHPEAKRIVDTLRDEGFTVYTERRYTLDADWRQVDEHDKVFTAIMDIYAEHPSGRVKILDWKTGKKYSMKHTQQGRLYASVAKDVHGVDECEVEFHYLDGGTPLILEMSSKLVAAANIYWHKEGEGILSYGKSVFAPPEDLAGLAPWYKDFLASKENYEASHFAPPYYAK